MSTSEAAVDRGNEVEDDDCPICLEPLPPFWDLNRRVALICCGKEACKDCYNKKEQFLDGAFSEGSYGREEEQLISFCPMCRTRLPSGADDMAQILQVKLEEGRLPLNFYRELGLSYLDGDEGVEVDAERGMEIMMLGAEKGDPNCQYFLGGAYQDGRDGLPKSLPEAKRWFLAAAEQGHAIAECNLAMISRNEGNGAEFLQYLKGSASKGFNEACYFLGRAHYKGFYGVEQSFEEAIRVLTPAAERGHAGCMSLLGSCMVNPDPDSKSSVAPWNNPDFTKGMHWMRRAAQRRDEDAISEMEELEEVASSKCFMCKKAATPEKAFLRCSRCRAAWYCSKDCQMEHWKAKEGGHKQCCIKWG